MTTVDELGEDALVLNFADWLGEGGVPADWLGDDTAVLASSGEGREDVFTSDALVEGIHFEPGTAPDRIGRKAVHRCLSDLAATAAVPDLLLLNLMLPGSTEDTWLESLMRSAAEAALTFGARIVGGDVTRYSSVQLHVFAKGSVPTGQAVVRSGACSGDGIYVTGTLGGSPSGHHLDFTPRIQEALWLREAVHPTAMMDLSDGLASDLPRLLKASRVGADMQPENIPISPAARERKHQNDPLRAALTDGEDYELLFTAHPDGEDKWGPSFLQTWNEPVTRIGRIVQNPSTLNWNLPPQTNLKGYTHFTQKQKGSARTL